MDEVNECIASERRTDGAGRSASSRRGVLRVSGPFTVEAVQPPEMSLGDVMETPIGGAPDEIEDTFVGGSAGTATADGDSEAKNAEAYLDQMMRLLKVDGVRFPDNKQMRFASAPIERALRRDPRRGPLGAGRRSHDDQEGRGDRGRCLRPAVRPGDGARRSRS